MCALKLYLCLLIVVACSVATLRAEEVNNSNTVKVEVTKLQDGTSSATTGAPQYMPVVLWHGMGDTCCFFFSMGHIKRLIERHLKGVYVYSVKVGKNIIDDEFHGFFGNVNNQIEEVASILRADSNLARGFNAVGFSQGGQFLRAYVERFNSPSIYNLVTMGGQHQGVFGFPHCPPSNNTFCEDTRRLLDLGAYIPEIQNISVQAQYWHDPLQVKEYQRKNHFLPDINNDGSFNATYKKNMLALNSFAMVQFLNDTMVIPKESEWFGFYEDGQDKVVLPLQDSTLYKQDLLGLQQLNNTGRLHMLGTIGDHLQFTDKYFVDNIINPYLNVTFQSN